jgi:hypothetical protein
MIGPSAERLIMVKILAFGLAANLIPFAAAAQTTVYSSATARSGQPVRVAYYFTVSVDCKISSLPVAVAAAPAHGIAVVKVSKLKTKRAKRCGEIEGPTNVLYYRSKADYTGDDTITYNVTSSSGKAREHVVHIKVTPGSQKEKPIDNPI